MSERIGHVRRVTWRGGNPRWYIDFGRRGRIFSIPMPRGETLSLDSPELAERVLGRIRNDVAAGVPLEQAIAPYLPRGSAKMKVAQRLEAWLEIKRRETKSGQLSPTYLRELERYASPKGHFSYLAETSVYELGYGVLQDWSLWLADQGLAAKTQRNVLGALRSFCSWLKRRGEIDAVPDFPSIAVDEHAPTIISPAQQDAVLAAIPAPLRGIFLALARLGIRPGEARALDCSDYRDGWITVARAVKGGDGKAPIRGTKTRRVRRLPLDELAPDLAAWIAEHVPARDRLLGQAPLFRNPGAHNRERRWLHYTLWETWQQACRSVGVKVGLYQGTKHTLGSALVERGVALDDVRKLFGHADARTTARYARSSEEAWVRRIRPRDEE